MSRDARWSNIARRWESAHRSSAGGCARSAVEPSSLEGECLSAKPRPDRQMVGRAARGWAHVHAGCFDLQILVDDDPVERGDRVAGVEARAGRGEMEIGLDLAEASRLGP